VLVVLFLCALPAAAQVAPWEDAMAAASAAWRAGRFADAERALLIAEREVTTVTPNEIRRAETLEMLARVYRAQSRGVDARRTAFESFRILHRLNHPRLVSVALLLADLMGDDALYEDARKLLTEVVQLLERALPSSRFELAGALERLARTYGVQGRNADAEPLLTRALALAEPKSPPLAGILESLAII